MPKLINNATRKSEDVSYDDLQNALQSGRYNLPSDSRFNIVDSQGQLSNVAGKDLFGALQNGYSLPPQALVDQTLDDQAKQEKYGHSELRAGLEGAARGATFGLSDVALSALGDKEGVRERRERNPISAGIGQAAGALGALVVPGAGEANLVKGAAGLSTRIAENPIVAGAISKYGAAALGSAVEGSLYGAGNVVSEAVLGDPSLNAEKALSEIGYGALLGGAAGGAFSTAADALPAAFNKAKALVSPDGAVFNAAVKGTSAVSGKSAEQIADAIVAQKGTLTSEQLAKASSDFSNTLDEQYTAVNKSLKEAFGKVRQIETEGLIDNSYLPAATQKLQEVVGDTESAIARIRSNPELYSPRYAGKLSQSLDILAKAPQDDAAGIYNSLNEFKKNIDPLAKFNKNFSPELEDSVNLVTDLRSSIKNHLQDTAAWGEAGARQSAFNSAFSEFNDLQKEVQKTFMKKSFAKGREQFAVNESKALRALNKPEAVELLNQYQDATRNMLDELEKTYSALPGADFDKKAALSILDKNADLHSLIEGNQIAKAKLASITPEGGSDFVSGVVGGTFGAPGIAAAGLYSSLKNPALVGQRLGALERLLNKAEMNLATATRSVFYRAVPSGIQAASAPEIREMTTRQYDKVVEQLQNFNADPGSAINNVSRATQGAFDAAPHTVNALNQGAINAANFLASKIPGADQAPLDQKNPPSDQEKAKFGVYYQTVQNPMSVLKSIKQGTLVPEQIETLSTVYPELYTQMQTRLMKEMTNFKAIHPKKSLPMSLQGSLSLFMGGELTSAYKPQNIAKYQGAFTQPALGGASSPIKPTRKGASSLNVAGRLLTPMQGALIRAPRS